MEPLTTKQASIILGVSRRRVIALIEQGKLKAKKFSNVYAILPKDLEAIRNRKNGRPEKTKDPTPRNYSKKPFKTIFDVAPDLIGSIKVGLPTDLSSNKEHLIGFGTKKGEKEALLRRTKLTNE